MIYDVQFGSADESKVYSLGEDKMFCVWNVSKRDDTPLMKMPCEINPRRLSPTITIPIVLSTEKIVLHVPTSGRNKLFATFCSYKYLLISSSEAKVLCEVRPL